MALSLQLGARLSVIVGQLQTDLTALQAVITAGSDPRPALDALAADGLALTTLCHIASNAHGQGMTG